ncbi:MAG: hypothetical protein IPP77_08910 [Bacteroidetes bacterium]|nr:hypothetical protein [Bacteroidota bacterium]
MKFIDWVKVGTLFLVIVAGSGCNKSDPPVISSTVLLNTSYNVDDHSLIFDSLMYVNAAGNLYSLNRLEYYISGITLLKESGDSIRFDSIFYIDAQTLNTNSFSLKDVPVGNYIGMTFHLGLRPDQNVSNSLPATSENVNMAWPDPMGGGYHFMKMEGHVKDSVSSQGYAVHLGNNMNLVTCVILHPFKIEKAYENIDLAMNINEWYSNPYTYDLLLDGNYTMGSMALMSKISKNGADVFTFK